MTMDTLGLGHRAAARAGGGRNPRAKKERKHRGEGETEEERRGNGHDAEIFTAMVTTCNHGVSGHVVCVMGNSHR